MITLRMLLDLYDNWNGYTRLNDDNLDKIMECRTSDLGWDIHNYDDCAVMAFGFLDNVFCVRIKTGREKASKCQK